MPVKWWVDTVRKGAYSTITNKKHVPLAVREVGIAVARNDSVNDRQRKRSGKQAMDEEAMEAGASPKRSGNGGAAKTSAPGDPPGDAAERRKAERQKILDEFSEDEDA